MITPDWYESTANVATLWDWLREHDCAPELEDVGYFLSKPWKWQPEWERRCAGLPPLRCAECKDPITTGSLCELCEHDAVVYAAMTVSS